MINIISIPGFSEPFSSLTHLISSLCFLIFGIRMIYFARGNSLRTFSLSLYVFCNVFLFSMSGVYHLLEKGTTANYVLQILDHAGIYIMISGSLTPFQIVLLRGPKRWLPLLAMWTLAITGLTLTSVFFSEMPEWLLLSFFIGMGWMSVFTVWFIRKVHPISIKLIFTGGMLYTLGALCEFLRWPNLFNGIIQAHEVFHLFVSAAAAVHFISIYKLSRLPISDKLTVYLKEQPDRFKAYTTTENAHFTASTQKDVLHKFQTWINESYLPQYKPKRVKIKHFKETFLNTDKL